jgi:hypothetical protein
MPIAMFEYLPKDPAINMLGTIYIPDLKTKKKASLIDAVIYLG